MNGETLQYVFRKQSQVKRATDVGEMFREISNMITRSATYQRLNGNGVWIIAHIPVTIYRIMSRKFGLNRTPLWTIAHVQSQFLIKLCPENLD
jgi:hypothetical protein